MSFYTKANFAFSTLASGLASDELTLAVSAGTGTKFPAAGTFVCVIWDAQYDVPDQDETREIIEVTARATDTFTIVRAREATAAKAWSTGAKIANVFTAGTAAQYETFESSQTAAAGKIPVTATITGNLPLIDGASLIWGDGSCGIAGSGATDIATLTGSLNVSGKLTVGTTGNSTYGLLITQADVNIFKGINTGISSATAGAGFLFASDDGAAVATGDRLGFINFGGAKDTSHVTAAGVTIAGFAAENWELNKHGTNVEIQTTNIGTSASTKTAKLRVLADGRILMGPTLPTDDTVSALQVNGPAKATKFVTVEGTTSAATGTATTLFALPSESGMYLVYAYVVSTEPIHYFTAMAVILKNGNNQRITLLQDDGAFLFITLSGSNVRGRQDSGVTKDIVWSYVRM